MTIKNIFQGGRPCFVVAEAGVNHNGNVELAKQLVHACVQCGADAVKFQTFQARKLVANRTPKAKYQIKNTELEESQLEMLSRLELTAAEYEEIARYADAMGILFMSTPFDCESVDLLDRLGVPVFKVSSGDLTYVPLLRHLASKGKPIILSTGMSSLEEVQVAVDVLSSAGSKEFALLQCVSEYPAPPDETNLRAMLWMRERFRCPVGYSDHTAGLEVAVAAVALGAQIVEKHLTLDRNLPGPDHRASLEPAEFGELVRQIRVVESALGDGVKKEAPSESETRRLVRRSIVAATEIVQGAYITEDLIECRRPENGIPALYYDSLLGRRAKKRFVPGDLLTWEGLE